MPSTTSGVPGLVMRKPKPPKPPPLKTKEEVRRERKREKKRMQRRRRRRRNAGSQSGSEGTIGREKELASTATATTIKHGDSAAGETTGAGNEGAEATQGSGDAPAPTAANEQTDPVGDTTVDGADDTILDEEDESGSGIILAEEQAALGNIDVPQTSFAHAHINSAGDTTAEGVSDHIQEEEEQDGGETNEGGADHDMQEQDADGMVQESEGETQAEEIMQEEEEGESVNGVIQPGEEATIQESATDEVEDHDMPDTITVATPQQKKPPSPLKALETNAPAYQMLLTPPPSAITRSSTHQSTVDMDRRRLTNFQVVIETPRRTQVATPITSARQTRGSVRKQRKEASVPREEPTPIVRKRKQEDSGSTTAVASCHSFDNDVARDVGLEEAPTEVVVLSLAIITSDDGDVPPLKKPRNTQKSGVVSPYFPTPASSQDADTVKPRRKRKTVETVSQYFSAAVEKPKGKRIAKGVSIIPWPPFTADRFGLVQEELQEKPFHLLIATTFLNRTRGAVAKPLLWKFLELYPTPEALSAADHKAVEDFIQPLGLHRIRADRMIKMAKTWIVEPPAVTEHGGKVMYNYPAKDTRPFLIPGREPCGVAPKCKWEITHLPGVGAYALDSWRIFCRDRLRKVPVEGPDGQEEEWRRVVPKDKELRAYCRWRWAKEGVSWVEVGDWGGRGDCGGTTFG